MNSPNKEKVVKKTYAMKGINAKPEIDEKAVQAYIAEREYSNPTMDVKIKN